MDTQKANKDKNLIIGYCYGLQYQKYLPIFSHSVFQCFDDVDLLILCTDTIKHNIKRGEQHWECPRLRARICARAVFLRARFLRARIPACVCFVCAHFARAFFERAFCARTILRT